MSIGGCSSGLVATAVLAVVLLPAQYYVPELGAPAPEPAPAPRALLPRAPPADLLATLLLLLLGLAAYLADWIQTKLMERRIVKLKEYLSASAERVAGWDARRSQQEASLAVARAAAAEYRLLLFLLLRRHRCLAPAAPAAPAAPSACPAGCFYDGKGIDDTPFISPPVEA